MSLDLPDSTRDNRIRSDTGDNANLLCSRSSVVATKRITP
jgi:hypothetical protein